MSKQKRSGALAIHRVLEKLLEDVEDGKKLQPIDVVGAAEEIGARRSRQRASSFPEALVPGTCDCELFEGGSRPGPRAT